MKKINSLTEKQKDAMPAYRDKWIAIGLRTGKTDWDTFDKAIAVCYAKAGLTCPKQIVRVYSPLVGAFAAMISDAILRNKVTTNGVSEAVGGTVGGAVDGAVGGAVDGSNTQLTQMLSRFISKYKINKKYLDWHSWLGGQFWVGGYFWWGCTFPNFFFDICNLKLSDDIMERAVAYRQICESVNYIWPNKNFVMVCARPVAISRDSQGRLHNERTMSISYPDGWGIYAWHGVRMEPWMIETPAEKLAVEKVLEIKNVEQRTACIQKIGIERFIQKAGAKKLDCWNDYELLEVSLNGNPCRYLKMKNPSVGIFHVEGVPNSCKTVAEALHARKPEALKKLPVDDVDGAVWYAQGDVQVWPKNAKSVRSLPIVQT